METATKFTLLAMGLQVLRWKNIISIAHMKRNNFLCAAETHRSERNVARWLPCRKVSRNLKYHTRTRELESTDTDTRSDLSNPTQQHQFRNRVRLKLQLFEILSTASWDSSRNGLKLVSHFDGKTSRKYEKKISF